MNQTQYNFSTSKTLVNILVYFLLFLAGDLFSSISFDLLFSFVELPSNALYVILRMLGALLLTAFLFWLYTTKGLHLKMKDFGITPNIKKWGVLISVFLPVFVTAIFAMIGKFDDEPLQQRISDRNYEGYHLHGHRYGLLYPYM